MSDLLSPPSPPSPQKRLHDSIDQIREFDLDAFAKANGINREASPPGSPSDRTSRAARYTLNKLPKGGRGGKKYTRKLKMGSRKYKTNKKQGGKKYGLYSFYSSHNFCSSQYGNRRGSRRNGRRYAQYWS